MFTRHVIMELKPNATTEFTNVVESKILPLLRKQKGFRDEITFVAPDRSEAIAISFWDTKEGRRPTMSLDILRYSRPSRVWWRERPELG